MRNPCEAQGISFFLSPPLAFYFNLSFSISCGPTLSPYFVPTYFPFPTSRYSSFQYYLILCILRSFSSFYACSLLPFCLGNNNKLGGLKPTTYSTYSLAAKLPCLDTASRAQLGYNIQERKKQRVGTVKVVIAHQQRRETERD